MNTPFPETALDSFVRDLRLHGKFFPKVFSRNKHSVTYVVHKEQTVVATLAGFALSDTNAWHYEPPLVAQEELPTF